jgi:hypothetical protein
MLIRNSRRAWPLALALLAIVWAQTGCAKPRIWPKPGAAQVGTP